MSPSVVRSVAAVLAVVLTTSCGTTFEDRRPDSSFPGVRRSPEPRVVFIPRVPRTDRGPGITDTELQEAVRWLLVDVRLDALRAEWRRIVSDARFRPLRASHHPRPFRLVLASWDSGEPARQAITRDYQRWCTFNTRRSDCITLPADRTSLNDSEVYEIAFDFAMGARWDGFTHELGGMVHPSTLRVMVLTGLVIFMACIAIPELTSKIPVAVATAVLTAYLGAQAVCDLVFGWIQMVREVEAATTFDQVRAAGERYGERIGAQTARILVMVAMAAIAEGGVIARLMKLPGNAAASAAVAKDTGGVGLESVPRITSAKVLQDGVTLTVDGVAQGTLGVAMAGRGGTPGVATSAIPKPPRKPVDLELRYKQDWTQEQRADARAKVEKLNQAKNKKVVKKVQRGSASASSKFRDDGNEVPPGCDVDHCVDLQLNGKDTLSNMWPLDSSVNRSLGSQIHHAIKNLPANTPIGRITID